MFNVAYNNILIVYVYNGRTILDIVMFIRVRVLCILMHHMIL